LIFLGTIRLTYHPTTDRGGSRDRPATDLRPKMVEAGVESMRSFLFEGHKVFESSHEDMVRAIWISMRRVQISQLLDEYLQLERECRE
jgi:hypothetical protein